LLLLAVSIREPRFGSVIEVLERLRLRHHDLHQGYGFRLLVVGLVDVLRDENEARHGVPELRRFGDRSQGRLELQERLCRELPLALAVVRACIERDRMTVQLGCLAWLVHDPLRQTPRYRAMASRAAQP